jgi:hypothetical protein
MPGASVSTAETPNERACQQRNRSDLGDVETVTRMGGAVERSEIDQIERVLNRELKGRFAAGAVQRGVLLQHGDEPGIAPGQLMVRVFIPAPARPEDYEQALAAWQDDHRTGMEELRRELSLRLPAAQLLEFTFDDPDTETPRLTMPDDGSLADEQLSGREIVTRALALLRANYVFPEPRRAGRPAGHGLRFPGRPRRSHAVIGQHTAAQLTTFSDNGVRPCLARPRTARHGC